MKVLRSFGIREDDPRLKHTIEKMREYELQLGDDCDKRHCILNKEQFKESAFKLFLPYQSSSTLWVCGEMRIFPSIRLIFSGYSEAQ